MSRSGRLTVAVVVLVAATAVLTAQQTSTQKPAQPTFRSVVTMVPINVRVLDGNGDPITDLKAGDFTIFENGQRQQIRRFSTMALTAETRESGTTPAFEQVLGPRTGGLTSQNRRVARFLAEGTTFTASVPLGGAALYLKVIAYDYGSDLVGTATRTLR